MVETGPPGQTLHAIGRAITPADSPGSWWLDLNMGGVHLPQMYRVAELSRSMTPQMIARHGFCAACLGFGVPQGVATEIGEQPPVNACSTCGGSGREMVKMTVERSPWRDGRARLDRLARGRRHRVLGLPRLALADVDVKRTRIRPVSKKRAKLNRERRKVLHATYGTHPRCALCEPLRAHGIDTGCNGWADDGDEILRRSAGGSIVEPANVRPVGRRCHDWGTAHPKEMREWGLEAR